MLKELGQHISFRVGFLCYVAKLRRTIRIPLIARGYLREKYSHSLNNKLTVPLTL